MRKSATQTPLIPLGRLVRLAALVNSRQASQLGSFRFVVIAAGDSLTFADPFTESGILNALFTARLVGMAGAGRISRSGGHSLSSSVLCGLVGHAEIHFPCAASRAPGRSRRYLKVARVCSIICACGTRLAAVSANVGDQCVLGLFSPLVYLDQVIAVWEVRALDR